MTTSAEAVAAAIETVESHLHPIPSWNLSDHPMPTGREEIWRFTPMKRFASLLSENAEAGALVWENMIPEGVKVTELSADEYRGLAGEAPVDRVAMLAVEKAQRRTRIDIPANVEIEEPITLTGRGQGGDLRENYVVTVGNHSKATIIIRFEGEGSFAEKSDFIIGDGAQVNLVILQDWQENALHGGQRSFLIGRDAHLKSVTASLGGDVRLQENARYSGTGGAIEAYGVYFVDGKHHVQHRLFVDHNAPHTKSDVDYRGALQGKGAHAVWIGDVLIQKVAENIETYESNKNLFLTEGCKADSVPNLEIETGEISDAGHSSSTGRFDDEQLYYLKSRGIPEHEARRLVVHGFFWEIIRRIGIPEIEQKLLERVEKELELLESAQA